MNKITCCNCGSDNITFRIVREMLMKAHIDDDGKVVCKYDRELESLEIYMVCDDCRYDEPIDAEEYVQEYPECIEEMEESE